MNHETYMKQALDLARMGGGHVSPHPLSGAVVVLNDQVLGSGYYQKYGSKKAAAAALSNSGPLKGSSLYLNLWEKEMLALIDNTEVAQVIIGTGLDENSRDILEAKNIEVIAGVMEEESIQLNEAYFHFQKFKRPFVHLVYPDGNHGSENELHRLRHLSDGLIVGLQRIERDNPSLTTQTSEFDSVSHPLRIILGPIDSLNKDWKILSDSFKRNTMFVTTDENIRMNQDNVYFLERNGVALLATAKNENGKNDLHSLLKSLGSLRLISLLIEGETDVGADFLRQGLVDKVTDLSISKK